MSEHDITPVDHVNTPIYTEIAKAPFTMIPNWVIQDTQLLNETRLAIIYLCSKPDNWTPRVFDLCRYLDIGDRVWRKVSKQLHDYKLMTSAKKGAGTHLSFKLPWIKPTDTAGLDTTSAQSTGSTLRPVHSVTVAPCEPRTTNAFSKNRSLNKNRSLIKNNNNVVEEINKRLPNLFVDTAIIDGWITKYGEHYVMSKVELAESKPSIKDMSAWLPAAIRDDYKATPTQTYGEVVKTQPSALGEGERKMEDPHKAAARRARIEQGVKTHFENRGIIDPRSKGGACDYEAVKAYDKMFNDEVYRIENMPERKI